MTNRDAQLKTLQAKNLQVTDLEGILERQVALYTGIEDRMTEKKRILVDGDANRLLTVDQELVLLGQQLTRLEADRLTALTHMGCPDQTLAQVIASLDPARAEPLRRLRLKLVRRLESIRALNDQVRALLDLSIRWVEGTVELIAQAIVPEASTYNRQGSRNPNLGSEDASALRASTIERQA